MDSKTYHAGSDLSRQIVARELSKQAARDRSEDRRVIAITVGLTMLGIVIATIILMAGGVL